MTIADAEARTSTAGATEDRLAEVVGTASEVVKGAGETASEVVRGASEVVREADRTLRGSSDQVLGLVAALSVGLAIGFIASGSSRLLVAASLVPAAMVAGVIVERMDRDARSLTRTA